MSETDSKSDSIDYDRSTYEYGPEPWKDPEILRQLYWNERLSMGEIADQFDIVKGTVKYWIDKFDIDTRPPMHERDRSVSRTTHDDGRVRFFVPDGDEGEIGVYLHQIVALEDDHLTDVFDDDAHVHHRIPGSPVLDVVQNLEVLSAKEHVRLHAGGLGHEQPEDVVNEIVGDDDG